jgi:hypothetical protein
MVQPVRVRLVFSRSGQKLIVDVPPHILSELAARASEQHRNRLELPIAALANNGLGSTERAIWCASER